MYTKLRWCREQLESAGQSVDQRDQILALSVDKLEKQKTKFEKRKKKTKEKSDSELRLRDEKIMELDQLCTLYRKEMDKRFEEVDKKFKEIEDENKKLKKSLKKK